jgi:hypothetical protein
MTYNNQFNLTIPIVMVFAGRFALAQKPRQCPGGPELQVNCMLGGRRYRGAEWKKKHHKKKIDTMYPMEYYSMYD